jgi:hypothetical protein
LWNSDFGNDFSFAGVQGSFEVLVVFDRIWVQFALFQPFPHITSSSEGLLVPATCTLQPPGNILAITTRLFAFLGVCDFEIEFPQRRCTAPHNLYFARLVRLCTLLFAQLQRFLIKLCV